jgi:hypothetical protein
MLEDQYRAVLMRILQKSKINVLKPREDRALVAPQLHQPVFYRERHVEVSDGGRPTPIL